MRLFAPVAVWILVLALAPAGEVLAQEEIFQQGNQLYQQEDWTGAVEAYRAVLDAGYESAELHYNLGNAHFKAGDLGRSILEWERALELSPGDPDALANLELARSLTVDDVEPLPRFWLFSALSWWIELIPRGPLILLVAGAWLATGAGVVLRILSGVPEVRRATGWVALIGGVVVVVFGTNLFVRELDLGQAQRAVVLAPAVPVRSAPAEADDLVLFEIHEGTTVRVDQRTGVWAEVVLEDGKVGWVPADVMELI